MLQRQGHGTESGGEEATHASPPAAAQGSAARSKRRRTRPRRTTFNVAVLLVTPSPPQPPAAAMLQKLPLPGKPRRRGTPACRRPRKSQFSALEHLPAALSLEEPGPPLDLGTCSPVKGHPGRRAFARAQTRRQVGDWPAALDAYRQAAAQNPAHFRSQFYVALCLDNVRTRVHACVVLLLVCGSLRMGRRDACPRPARMALPGLATRAASNLEASFNGPSHCFTQLGKHGEAVAAYETALGLRPSCAVAAFNAARLLLRVDTGAAGASRAMELLHVALQHSQGSQHVPVLLCCGDCFLRQVRDGVGRRGSGGEGSV